MMALVGLVMMAGAAAALWALLPKDGKTSWAATAPVIQDVFPLGIVAAFAVGLLLIIFSI